MKTFAIICFFLSLLFFVNAYNYTNQNSYANAVGAYTMPVVMLGAGVLTLIITSKRRKIKLFADNKTSIKQDDVTSNQLEFGGSFLNRYWFGNIKLWISFWLYYFIGSVIVLVGCVQIFINTLLPLFMLIEDSINEKTADDLALVIVLSAPAVALMYHYWASAGVWRSAGHHAEQNKGVFLKYVTRVFVVVFTAGFLVINAKVVSSSVNSYLAESYQVDNDLYDLTVEHEFLYVKGEFTPGMDDEAKILLESNPAVKMVRLESIGGNARIGRKMAKLFETYKVDTFVSEYCHSACTSAFLGGKNRIISQNAKLGFHGLKSPVPVEGDSNAMEWGQNAKDTFYEEHGIPNWFIEKMRNTQSSQLWFPSKDLLVSSGYVTQIDETE